MILGLLADEDGLDRLAGDGAHRRRRGDKRHGAHFEPADKVGTESGRLLGKRGANQARAFGVEHGRLQIQVYGTRPAGCELEGTADA